MSKSQGILPCSSNLYAFSRLRFRTLRSLGLVLTATTLTLGIHPVGIATTPVGKSLWVAQAPPDPTADPATSDQPMCEETASDSVTSEPDASTLASSEAPPSDTPPSPSFTEQVTSLLTTLEPVLVARLSERPFPEIHPRARLAKVPIMMYHDILPEKEVFFDVTPAEFEADLQLIQEKGLTPITLDQLTQHLSSGTPLPEKPILLTFDDGYEGHYTYVLPLLRKYGYPGVFAIYTSKVGQRLGRSSLNWDQLREMAADPLVTIAAHSVTHPDDLGELPDAALRDEVVESKRILEAELGIPIRDFVYPAGKYDERVKYWTQLAGYRSAMTMDDAENKFAGESESLLEIDRIGQSQLERVIDQAYGGPPMPRLGERFVFNAPIQKNELTIDDVRIVLISGGKPITIHADTRYQVPEIIANTPAVAAVDGGFFSLKYLDSNQMVGPVLSQNTQQFVPGIAGEIPLITGRPLVLIGPNEVKFIPFDPTLHNTLDGIRAEMPEVTDAFVAAAWLVKDGIPQPRESFGTLFDFDVNRHRAFWGIDMSGQPVIGVSKERVDSITLGEMLGQAGLRDAIMLDSGASTSLAYQGESLVEYEPRPVPHVVALVPDPATMTANASCLLSADQLSNKQNQ